MFPAPSNWAKDPDIVGLMTSPGRWVDPQTARQLRVADTCRKLDPAPPNMTRTYRHLLVDDKTKTMYCYVPKAACTSWKFLMLNLTKGNMTIDEGASDADGADFRAYRNVHFDHDLKSLHRYSPAEREYRLRTYFKFIVVRHPLERLVSAYRDKFVKRQHEFLEEAVRIRIMFRPRFSENHDYVTFEEFLRYVVSTGTSDPPQQNQHWATYQNLCQPCFVKYDHIGKLETLAEDSEIILKIMGLPRNALPLLHVQSSAAPQDYFRPVRTKFYHRAVELYAIDLEMFGYNNTALQN